MTSSISEGEERAGIGQDVRFAMSTHDTHSPLTVVELTTLASEMEEMLVAGECQFSHPDWRYVDGLRALALQIDEENGRRCSGKTEQAASTIQGETNDD